MQAFVRRVVNEFGDAATLVKHTRHFTKQDWGDFRTALVDFDGRCEKNAAVATTVAVCAPFAGFVSWLACPERYSWYFSDPTNGLCALGVLFSGVATLGSISVLSVLKQERFVVEKALQVCETGSAGAADTIPDIVPPVDTKSSFKRLHTLLETAAMHAAQHQNTAVKRFTQNYDTLQATFRQHEVAVRDLERVPSERHMDTATATWTDVHTGVVAAHERASPELEAEVKSAISRTARVEQARDLVRRAEGLLAE